MKVKIGVIGSRRRNTPKDKAKLKRKLKKMIEVYGKKNIKIVSGGCKQGGDKFAEELVDELGLGEPIIHYPDKSKLRDDIPPRAAYAQICYARNELIARDSDIIIALVAADRKGGTENTLKHFRKKYKEDATKGKYRIKLI